MNHVQGDVSGKTLASVDFNFQPCYRGAQQLWADLQLTVGVKGGKAFVDIALKEAPTIN